MSDYVFNRACADTPFNDTAVALDGVADWLTGLAVLDGDEARLPAFRADLDPWLIPICDCRVQGAKSLGELAHSLYGTAHHDAASYFDALLKMIPAEVGLPDAVVEAVLRLDPKGAVPGFEEVFAPVEAADFDVGMCAASQSTLVGLVTAPLWDRDALHFMAGDSAYMVDHVASSDHAATVRRRRVEGLRGGLTAKNFGTVRTRAFPNLSFGADVDGQLEKFSANLLPLLFRRLADLDSRTASWKLSALPEFPEGTPAITPETPETMLRYGADRRFRSSSGAQVTYEEHLWVDGLHRIHIFRDTARKTVEVGYVGPHLPTMTYRT